MWRNREFVKLWSGQAISSTGTVITAVAMPLVAVLTLHVSPVEMGVLAALNVLPHLVFGLPAGLWVSRFSLRRLLIVADVGRALLLGAIPVLAAIGHLQMLHLYLVAAAAGVLTLLSDTASQSLLPVLVARDDLMSANSATLFTQTVATTTGPSLAGALVTAVSAPFAIAFDAISYAASAVTSVLLKEPRRPVLARGQALSLTGGLRVLYADPVLRALLISATAAAACGAMQAPLVVLYLIRELHWSPVLVGIAITVSGAASALGALFAPAYGRALGLGRAYITGQLLASLSGLALAAALTPLAFLSQLLTGVGMPLYGVPQRTLRQLLVPPALLPQTTAAWRTLVIGGQTAGALASGLLATAVGLRVTFVLATAGMLTAGLYSARSPLRGYEKGPSAGD
ncbi:MFS transporter [Kribbella catacumbae]|uniref:MFS transporter n=1 Tax=Kribbella catacumbae TaxID=460086 RepID=UPI00035DCB57|nr:MFS transporter [Kribbella catacumbae]